MKEINHEKHIELKMSAYFGISALLRKYMTFQHQVVQQILVKDVTYPMS